VNTEPVVGLDIDGTLGEYHDHFRVYAANYIGRDLPCAIEYDGTQPFWKYLGLSKETYRKAKLAFRRGGAKRWMPVYGNARELTVNLRKQGVRVVLCTTRPYLSHDEMEQDTVQWCKRNGGQFDGMLSGEHKYRHLCRRYGKPNVVAVVDDLPELALQASDLGLPGLLVDQSYNRHSKLPTGFRRVANLWEAEEELSDELTDWRQRHEAAD